MDVIAKRAPRRLIVDEHEIPWLGQADARCGMRGGEDAVEDVGRNRRAGELGSGISAPEHRFVQTGGGDCRDGGHRCMVPHPVQASNLRLDPRRSVGAMTVAVRDFEQSDLDWVNRLRSVAFGGPTWGTMPLDGWRGFVAELPGGPCGFLRIYDYAQYFGGVAVPMGGLASVAVTPHARGRGVASALLDAALAAMREDGHCVSALFPSVASLYRIRGWEQVGVLQWLDLRIDRLLRFGDARID